MDSMSIELSVEFWNIILRVLGRQPYADVFMIIEEIKRQGDAKVGTRASVDRDADT